MTTKLLTTTFIGEALEPSIIDEILSLDSNNQDQLFTTLSDAITLSTLSHAYESIEDTHQRAAFLANVPKLLAQEISIEDLARFKPELPALVREHISRTLLSIRTKLKNS
jgi:hypothetical protein